MTAAREKESTSVMHRSRKVARIVSDRLALAESTRPPVAPGREVNPTVAQPNLIPDNGFSLASSFRGALTDPDSDPTAESAIPAETGATKVIPVDSSPQIAVRPGSADELSTNPQAAIPAKSVETARIWDWPIGPQTPRTADASHFDGEIQNHSVPVIRGFAAVGLESSEIHASGSSAASARFDATSPTVAGRFVLAPGLEEFLPVAGDAAQGRSLANSMGAGEISRPDSSRVEEHEPGGDLAQMNEILQQLLEAFRMQRQASTTMIPPACSAIYAARM